MNKGLPIFKMANRSIKGWFPTAKDIGNDLIPFVSTLEEDFLYYAEYNPILTSIERADVDESFTDKYKLSKSPFAPIIIPYIWEDEVHRYYPDFFITLNNGETVIVEIGKYDEKMTKIALAKAAAAIEFCNSRGWSYWLITDENIMSKIKKDNLILLKSFDKLMYKNHEIQNSVLKVIEDYQYALCIGEIVDKLSDKNPKKEVEMAIYELINSAAKEGRFLFDYDNECLSNKSVIKLIDYSKPVIIPDLIHLTYEIILNELKDENKSENETDINLTGAINTFIDAESLSEEDKVEFARRRVLIYNKN